MRWTRGIWIAGLTCVVILGLSGCAAVGIVAVAAQATQDLPRTVKAKYADLEGHSFAVVVNVPRHVQARHPVLRQALTFQICGRLEEHFSKADLEQPVSWIPPESVLEYLFNHPRWPYQPRGELLEDLGVDRLIFVEIDEYRLVEPGNRYVWDGLASGRVQVFAGEAPLPDEPVYEQAITVRFPDESNVTEEGMSDELVARRLISRFSDRAAWIFFDHKEPGSIAY